MRKRSLHSQSSRSLLMLPIYWLVTMSFKTTNEILGALLAFPKWTSPSKAT